MYQGRRCTFDCRHTVAHVRRAVVAGREQTRTKKERRLEKVEHRRRCLFPTAHISGFVRRRPEATAIVICCLPDDAPYPGDSIFWGRSLRPDSRGCCFWGRRGASGIESYRRQERYVRGRQIPRSGLRYVCNLHQCLRHRRRRKQKDVLSAPPLKGRQTGEKVARLTANLSASLTLLFGTSISNVWVKCTRAVACFDSQRSNTR